MQIRIEGMDLRGRQRVDGEKEAILITNAYQYAESHPDRIPRKLQRVRWIQAHWRPDRVG